MIRGLAVLFLLLAVVATNHDVQAQNATAEAPAPAPLNASAAEAVLDAVDEGKCLAGATGLITCGANETACTCFEEIVKQEEQVAKNVNRDSTCEVMTTEICGLIEKVRECCEPCLKFLSQTAVCDNDFLKDNDCSAAQECAAQGIVDGALSFRTSSVVVGVIGTLVTYWMM